jgi:hypothetical protein
MDFEMRCKCRQLLERYVLGLTIESWAEAMPHWNAPRAQP